MCRIAGVIDPQLTAPERERMVKIMCDAQQRGGPDDEGIYSPSESFVSLGNRRLSFNDLSAAGHQPMSFNNRYSITFNGEIYNFKSIKKQLEQLGVVFKSESDTEVVLAAFAQWGTNSFSKLHGMYAFAIHDSQTQTVVLARDPAGIKPLYYAIVSNKLYFASEFRAFKNIGITWNEDPHWQIAFLAFGHLPEPITPFAEVKVFPKGKFLILNCNTNETQFSSFHTYRFQPDGNKEIDQAEWVRNTLGKAVEQQLFADVPVGVFLSGGIDSSILTLLANQKNKKELNTLSICFDEDEYSEKKYQDLIFEKITGRKNQFVLSNKIFQLDLPNVLADMDMPSSDGINSWFICKHTKELGLKGVLSGIGADELMGGYPSFNRIEKIEQLQKLPSSILKGLSMLPGKIGERLPFLQLDGVQGKYLFLRGHFGMKQIANQLNLSVKEVAEILNGLEIQQPPALLKGKNLASWIEFHLYMQNQLLRDADAMSMVHGIEIRVPFLDHDFIEGMMQMDPQQKFIPGIPKQLLVNAFKDQLPEPVWNRKKMGFSFPFSTWLKNNDWIRHSLEVNNKNADQIIKNFQEEKMSWSCFLMLLMLGNHGKS
jgi:asparagine synthase (glutamine-hydrolysing)